MRKFSGLAGVKNILHLSSRIFKLDIFCPEVARQAKPGQFIQVKLNETSSHIWARPFSIHKAFDDMISISVKKCGTVTEKMAQLKPDDKIFVTGPHGNSFKPPEPGRSVYLVAGGVGLPPLHFLSRTLIADGYPGNMLHFYSGARTCEELFADSEMKESSMDYIVATDDGSCGIKGFITEPLGLELTRIRTAGVDPHPVIYGCGPSAMLKKVAEICFGLECYLSLEQLMPCGWGVCHGCAVKVKKKDDTPTGDGRDFALARVCKEGPVFDASEVLWE
jgi:dihydroorotate dehydrogenase electron transfer subunit